MKPFCLLIVLLFNISTLSFGQNCDMGFYHNGQACISCDHLCLDCISPFICTSCHPQSCLIAKNERLICNKCSQLMEGCLRCSSADTCNQCQHGYIFSQQKCLNALHQDSKNNLKESIISCEIYEVIIDGRCVIPHPNCQLFNNDGSCKSCLFGCQMVNSYCIPSSIVAQQQNDQSSKAKQIKSSLICNQRQYIQNEKCVTIGKACLNFLQSGFCLQCDSGFALYQGLCVQLPKENIQKKQKKPLIYAITNKTKKGQPITNSNEINIIKTVNNQFKKNGDSNKIYHTQPIILNNPEQTNFIKQDMNLKTLRQSPSTKNGENKQNICDPSCATCTDDPFYCLACAQGYTSVDDISFIGKCFQF